MKIHLKRPWLGWNFYQKYVYDLFPEEVIKEIEARNPTIHKNNKSYRKNRYHQFLTTDIGIPQLDHYISKLLGIMALSENNNDFDKNFKKAFKEEIELKRKRSGIKNKAIRTLSHFKIVVHFNYTQFFVLILSLYNLYGLFLL